MKIYSHTRLVYLVSGLSIAVLVIFGLLYMEKSREQVRYIDAVEHTYKVLSAIDFCEKILMSAEANQRGYLLTGEDIYKDHLEATLPLIDPSLKAIGAFTSNNNNQKTFYFQLAKFVTARVQKLKENLSLKGTDPLYFEKLRSGLYIMDNCRLYMGKMRRVEEDLLQESLEKKNKYQRLNLSFFKATFITSCLICIFAIGFFFRELSIRLKAQLNLKAKINELSISKHELEEITFAASHDLQEPMRKVRILSNLLTKNLVNKIPDEDLDPVFRINRITEQMHSLLNDLVLYTNLLNPNEKYTRVNLYDAFKEAYFNVIKNENIEVRISSGLPVIYGSHSQLVAMISHLLDNALKFKAPGRELVITVQYEVKKVRESKYFWEYVPSKLYHQVIIIDNGIGFDKQYNEKIFGLFQRLHSQTEYPGKGIGLSVARKVMSNHKGFISAHGEKMAGASFILNFPVVS